MSSFKFNWGWGVFIALSLFVAAMAYTVYLTFQNDYVLETENYYQKELEFDDVIEATRLGQTLFPQTAWEADSTGNVHLVLPMKVDSASCDLLHPANSAWDKDLDVQVQENHLTLRFSEMQPEGVLWRLELSAYVKGEHAMVQKRWKY